MSIEMGNDEFILHIRKQYPACAITNDQLGKRIWQWLRTNDPTAEIVEDGEDQPCMWGESSEITSDISLPKTAAQFSFSIDVLPRLYVYLGTLADGSSIARS